MSTYFLAVRLGLRPDWEEFALAPKATRSKKAESQAAEIAEKQAKLSETALGVPGLTVIEDYLCTAIGGGTPDAAWRCDHRQSYADRAAGLAAVMTLVRTDGANRCYCLGFPHLMQVVVSAAAGSLAVTKTGGLLSHGSALHPSNIFVNPFHMAVPSSPRDTVIDFYGYARAIGITLPENAGTLEGEVALVRSVVQKLGM